MGSPFFELNNILKLEAQELTDARKRAISIHRTDDIDAAGEEVEQAVRNLIRKKLPLDYYMGHGFIVDENLKHNGQYDIVIADNSGSPILFTTSSGSQYFPYESLYAVGEVKSTYYSSKNYISKFIEKTIQLYNSLNRAPTPSLQVTKDVSLSVPGGILKIESSDKRPYKNPIFKFIVCIDGGDFKLEDLFKIYQGIDDKYLPNVICLLNRGIVVKTLVENTSLGGVELFPEFIPAEKAGKYKWVFLGLGDESDMPAANLAFLYFSLNQHLRHCLVLRPDLLKYFGKMWKVKKGKILNL